MLLDYSSQSITYNGAGNSCEMRLHTKYWRPTEPITTISCLHFLMARFLIFDRNNVEVELYRFYSWQYRIPNSKITNLPYC